MKKSLLICALVLLAACETQTINKNDPYKTRLKVCATNESLTRIQNGTAFNGTLKAVAGEISQTCLQKLALQDMGIDAEAAQTTQNILSGLLKAQ